MIVAVNIVLTKSNFLKIFFISIYCTIFYGMNKIEKRFV